MGNQYDNDTFFAAYAEMDRSKHGLAMAGEWHQLQPLFPELRSKTVLDLGCGYALCGMGKSKFERKLENGSFKYKRNHLL